MRDRIRKMQQNIEKYIQQTEMAPEQSESEGETARGLLSRRMPKNAPASKAVVDPQMDTIAKYIKDIRKTKEEIINGRK